jgi:hypothetical protein
LLDDATRGPALAVFGAILAGIPIYYLFFGRGAQVQPVTRGEAS